MPRLFAFAALLLSALGCGAAQAQDLKLSEQTLTVSGIGSVSVAPDRIALTVTLESDGETAGEALERHTVEYERVRAALQSQGVDLSALQAAQVIVSRQGGGGYGTAQGEGFVAGRTFVVHLDDADVAETLLRSITADDAETIEAMLDVGRREVQLARFVSDPTPHEDEALALAMRRARTRAELAAEAGGVTLGSVVAIYEQGGERANMQDMLRLAAMQGEGGLSGAEVTFQAQVVVTFDLVTDD